MTASEFAFLALGLLLGVASGAALIVVLRSRPPAKREVRVTVAPNSIPRRATTLTESEAVDRGPARGGPADRRWVDRDLPPDDELPLPVTAVAATAVAVGLSPIDPDPDERTPVPSGSPLPPFTLAPLAASGGTVVKAPPRPAVGIAIESEPDPMVAALRATAAATANRAMANSTARTSDGSGGGQGPATAAGVSAAAASGGVLAATASAQDEPAAGGGPGPAPVDTGGSGSVEESTAGAPDDACADQRRVADERCAVATRARDGAKAALETLRLHQRAYDDHVSRAEAEAAAADPRAVRDAKEAAQQAFRVARSAGGSRDDIEAAARDWLTEINRINLETRDATSSADKHRTAAAEIARNLERLSVEADAARISAEAADEACVAAREAVAACQEAAAIAAAGGSTPVPLDVVPLGVPQADEDAATTPMGSRAGEDAAIIRLLRGDREVMTRIVAKLGGDDEAARRHWQVLLTGLIEALIARTIEASAFDFPLENSFWTPFTRSQARDIMAALASLGYRHDGFGGWAEDRVPSQRDLSLAVGYAGLDPMRIRRWPGEAEMRDILREVTVAVDEYVWESAGGLTLGELVSLLGLRADGLAELWNEWGVIRPMLLSAD